MNNVRTVTTEKEKLAQGAFGLNGTMLSMNENNIQDMIVEEKKRQLNNLIEALNETLEANNEKFKNAQEEIGYDLSKASIKPILARILVHPFERNPFQQMEVKNGIIVDSGGYNPHTQINPMTGRYEEQEQFIVVGAVAEVGPETKYIKPGDAVYYRKDTAVPVPFLKQKLVSLNENLVIAHVNIDLDSRIANTKMNEIFGVSVEDLPNSWGETVEERVKKYLRFKKEGIAVV